MSFCVGTLAPARFVYFFQAFLNLGLAVICSVNINWKMFETCLFHLLFLVKFNSYHTKFTNFTILNIYEVNCSRISKYTVHMHVSMKFAWVQNVYNVRH